jgi:hypothetical protein
MSVSMSPIFNDAQFFDNDGAILAGGKIFTYAASSNSTEQATYRGHTGAIANTNPIVLDSAGRLPAGLWLTDGAAYNLVLTLPDGTTVVRSEDNIRGNQEVSAVGDNGTLIWNIISSVPTYQAANQFSFAADFASKFVAGNRIQYKFTDNTYAYGTVRSSAFSDPTTTVIFVPDSVGFNNTVTAVWWSSAIAVNTIVDAGAVAFTNSLTYAGATVGTQLQYLMSVMISKSTTWETTGTAPYYSLTPNFIPPSLTGQSFRVKFMSAQRTGSSYLNVGGLGNKSLKQYSTKGVKIDAVLETGMISDVAYDGTDLIVLNPIPSTPSGTIIFSSSPNLPPGYVLADGASWNKFAQPGLFDAISYTFGGSGDWFNVPDMRGQFPRGFDNGRGVDPGRGFGSTQAGQMESHNHRMVWTWYDGGGGRGLVDPVNPVDITTPGQGGGNVSWGNTFAGTGTETRPTNVALYACIKL